MPFEREISVVAARGADGQIVCFDVTENDHRDHILKISRAPAAITEALAAEARDIAETIANAFDYVGVLAVEMFVVPETADRIVLVNEIAPRVHNSGHWTLDGATVSQFEQHIRAIAGWPLASRPPRRRHHDQPDRRRYPELPQWLSNPGATVHLYGKGRAAGPQDGPCHRGDARQQELARWSCHTPIFVGVDAPPTASRVDISGLI